MSLFKFPDFRKRGPNMDHVLIGQCPHCYQSLAQCRCAPIAPVPEAVQPKKIEPDLPSTLDELWPVATGFGRVKLEQNHDKTKHEAAINFNTKAGSYVSAKGEASSAVGALRAAIKEAAALQCGVEFANS